MNWSGCPFSLHLLPEGDRPIIPNEIKSESRLTAMGVMIDSRDNKVMAIKDFTFEPEFTQKLYEILKKQEHNPLGTDELGSIVQKVYRLLEWNDRRKKGESPELIESSSNSKGLLTSTISSFFFRPCNSP